MQNKIKYEIYEINPKHSNMKQPKHQMEGASESLSIARDRAAIAKHALQENNFAPPARPDAAQRARTVRHSPPLDLHPSGSFGSEPGCESPLVSSNLSPWRTAAVFGRGAARAEDAQGTPTQSHISPSILVYEEKLFALAGALLGCVTLHSHVP
jgi:hypothetical protein